MISKNEIKYIQSLYHKKNRDIENTFIAEGAKIVDEILKQSYHVKKIFATEEWNNANLKQTTFTQIAEHELQKVSQLQTPNQVLALVEKKKLPDNPDLANKLTLVLDGIQDPGNLGTIIRIADWFNITQIVAAPDTVDIYNSKVIQSTMASFMRVNVWYKDLHGFLAGCKMPVYGAMLDGENVYSKKIKEGLLVIGNESKGIRTEIQSFIQHKLTIPKVGAAESLNAAVATGIILSHIL